LRHTLFLLCTIFCLHPVVTNAQKRAPVHFPVKQDDDQRILFMLDIPPGSIIDSDSKYAWYEQGKSSLTINYELDDNPELTVRKAYTANGLDLLKYSTEIPAGVLTGSTDITISNKTVDAAVTNYNGFETVKLTYNYSHLISGANVTETGKAVLYIIKVSGTSLITTADHTFIVRLKFDYQQKEGNDLSKLDAQIITTIKKGTD